MKTQEVITKMVKEIRDNKVDVICHVCKRKYTPYSNRDCFICLEVESNLRFNIK